MLYEVITAFFFQPVDGGFFFLFLLEGSPADLKQFECALVTSYNFV